MMQQQVRSKQLRNKMRQETLKKDACGAQRGPTRYPPFAHTCHITHTHTNTQTYKHTQRTASNVFRLYPGQSWPTRTGNRLSAHNLSSFLSPSPHPPASPSPCSIWFRYVFVLVLSLFKCQLHSTFIQICVARICLDIARHFIIHNKHTHRYRHIQI